MNYKEKPNRLVKSKIEICNTLIKYEKKRGMYIDAYNKYKKERLVSEARLGGDKETAVRTFKRLGDKYSLGVIACESGEYEQGIKYFGGNNFAVGICKYKIGHYEDALEEFIKVDDSEAIGRAKLFSGECSYKLGRFWEAEKYYKQAIAEFRVQSASGGSEFRVKNEELRRDAMYGAGWSCFRLSKYEEAGELFENLAKLLQEQKEDKLRLASMYYAGRAFYSACLRAGTHRQAGEVEKAKIYLQRVLFEYPGSRYAGDVHYWLGKIYYFSGNYADSRSEMWLLLKWYSGNKYEDFAYLTIGDAYFAEENYESAIRWYGKVGASRRGGISASLQDSARFKIEECRYKLGAYDSYMELLAGFMNKYPESPRSPEYGIKIANYWRKKQEYKEAMKWYSIVQDRYGGKIGIIEYRGNGADWADKAKFELAECYLETGDLVSSLSLYGELLDTKMCVKAQFGIANVYTLMEEYSRAISEYKNLIKRYPNSFSARESQYQIGEMYEKLSRPEEARISFTEFLEQYPKDSRYWSIKLKIAKGEMAEGNIESAYSSLLEIESRGKGEEVYESAFLLGNLYFENSNYKIAKRYYLKAASGYKSCDKKARSLLQAAKCALSLSDLESAKEFYEEIMLIEPNPVLEQEAREGLERIKNSMQN